MSNTRRKKYHPKSVCNPRALLRQLPVSNKALANIRADKETRLIHLRNREGDFGSDVLGLVVQLGQAWLLSDDLDDGEKIRQNIEDVVKDVMTEVSERPDLSEGLLDRLADAIDIALMVVARSTGAAYEQTRDRIFKDGGVKFVVDFCILLQAKGLLRYS